MKGPLEINLRKIVAARGARIPGFAVSVLERIICQEDLNAMLRAAYPARGSAFARRILEYLEITVSVRGLDKLPPRRLMFAGNHPLGGLDGIALIAVLGSQYGDNGIRFLVNDLLMNVEPLRELFLPVNKYGHQGREAAKAIAAALHSDMQVFQFPAGLVSRLQPDGSIADLTWQKAFVAKAIETERDIVPVRFMAANRSRFYRLAKWRKQLRVKFNLEQVLLPSELVASRGKHFDIIFGDPISWESLRDDPRDARAIAAEIRRLVYNI